MKWRSAAFGAALTVGGLAGAASGWHEASDTLKITPVVSCQNNPALTDVCARIGMAKPDELYAAIISGKDTSGDVINADALRIKLGMVAWAAGSVLLLNVTRHHINESLLQIQSQPEPAHM